MKLVARIACAFVLMAGALGALPAAAQPFANNGNPVIAIGGGFNAPAGVSVDADGNVVAADTAASAVDRIPAGCVVAGCVTTIGGGFSSPGGVAQAGGQTFITDSGTGEVSEIPAGCVTAVCVVPLGVFSAPVGIALDGAGNLYVVESGTGRVLQLTATSGYATVNVVATGFTNPAFLAIDLADNIYVSDSAAGTVTEFAAADSYAHGVVIASGLDQPLGVAVDRHGNLFIAEAGSTFDVLELPSDGSGIFQFAFGFGSPFGVAVDPDDDVYVGDSGAGQVYLVTNPPVVDSVNANSGPSAGGNTVTISGSHFYGTSLVQFVQDSPHTATNVDVVDSHTVTVTVPAGTAGLADVQVTALGGASNIQSNDQYYYYDPPTVTGVSPTAGPVAGGNTVTVTGTNLSSAFLVQFGGNTASALAVQGDTQLTVSAPPGSFGTVDVTVTTAGGTSATSSADHYAYVNPPAVSSVSPSSGPTAGGTPVTVGGNNFTGATAVFFGGASASFSVTDDNHIAATSPTGSAGTVDVTVVTAGGTSPTSALDRFTYIPPAPTVTSVGPSQGPTGGGTSVTIGGTNFVAVTAVKFGVSNATGFTVNSPISITATAPVGAGTVDITVANTGGTSATGAADHYTYVAPPTVTSVSPGAGPTAGGTSVTIAGTNFTGATAVKFGSTNATGFIVNSSTQITATSPNESAGTVDVTVTTAGGTSATGAADNYTFDAPPTVTSVNPGAGPTAGGTSVTVAGTNFTGATAVKFGSANAASFTVNSAIQITATTAAQSAGTVDVTVATPGGTSATGAADRYTFAVAPSVTGLNPTSGTTNGGTSVTITGNNLGGATAVTFGASNAAGFTVNGPTQITATSPTASPGTVDVRVTTPGGISAAAAADRYTFVAPPGVTILYRFTGGGDGEYPRTTLALDDSGALYGAIPGSASRNGNVFRLSPPVSGPDWSFAVLHNFKRGEVPNGVLLDQNTETLFATTQAGGKCCGIFFDLTHVNAAPAFARLYDFEPASTDADQPVSPLVADGDGALYGMSAFGVGSHETHGTVFRLKPPKHAGDAWTESVIYSFQGGADGEGSANALLVDSNGVVYGVTPGGAGGGNQNFGTVFSLTPPSGSGRWKKTTLYSFGGRQDGALPSGPLAADPSGALYGVTERGGQGNCAGVNAGCGTVFMLTPPHNRHTTAWTETVIYRFRGGNDGAFPAGALAFDNAGALYGATTQGGGSANGGIVFELTPPPSGPTWSETVLHRFPGGANGGEPEGGVVIDGNGTLYGVTRVGGLSATHVAGGLGTIYKLVP